MSETTFDSTTAAAAGASASAEGSLADVRASRQHWEQVADQMQALGVDGQSLSHAMEMIDGYRQAETALGGIQDSAAALPQTLRRNHGGLNEAHQSSPVEAADKTFYAG